MSGVRSSWDASARKRRSRSRARSERRQHPVQRPGQLADLVRRRRLGSRRAGSPVRSIAAPRTRAPAAAAARAGSESAAASAADEHRVRRRRGAAAGRAGAACPRCRRCWRRPARRPAPPGRRSRRSAPRRRAAARRRAARPRSRCRPCRRRRRTSGPAAGARAEGERAGDDPPSRSSTSTLSCRPATGDSSAPGAVSTAGAETLRRATSPARCRRLPVERGAQLVADDQPRADPEDEHGERATAAIAATAGGR